LVIFLNLVLAGLRLDLKNYQVGKKWFFDDYSYLCKGLLYKKQKKSFRVGSNTIFKNKMNDMALTITQVLTVKTPIPPIDKRRYSYK